MVVRDISVVQSSHWTPDWSYRVGSYTYDPGDINIGLVSTAVSLGPSKAESLGRGRSEGDYGLAGK